MDNIDFIFPPDLSSSILKGTVYLDDIPVESLLYRNTTQPEPTSPDLFTFWSEGGVLDQQSEMILLEILLNNVRYAFDETKKLEASLLFEKAVKKTNNPDQKANLLIGLWQLYQTIDPEKAEKRFDSLERHMKNHKAVISEQIRSKWITLCKIATINPYQLRASAMDKLERGQYAEAEKIYRQMINMDFELPGTLCHLARVQLLMDNEKAARKSLCRAWRLKGKALNYVLPRIIFFKIMLALLGNKNPSKWVYELKSALKDESCFMAWTIKPTINHYQSRLLDDDFSILMILAEVLQDFQNKYLVDESIELK
jgi:tetratricopeptide (TPR) repeat protein